MIADASARIATRAVGVARVADPFILAFHTRQKLARAIALPTQRGSYKARTMTINLGIGALTDG